jgi:hypothetical protein
MSKTTEETQKNEVTSVQIEVPHPAQVKVAKKDTQRCSSCGKWKTPDLFDGKATCNECRPKKRRQGAVAVAEKRATMDKIGEQNTTLMFLVKQQAVELAQRRIEDQRQKEIIVHMQREIKQLRAYIETKGRSVYVPEKPETNINAPDLLAAAMTWTQQHTPDDIDPEKHIHKKSKKEPALPPLSLTRRLCQIRNASPIFVQLQEPVWHGLQPLPREHNATTTARLGE